MKSTKQIAETLTFQSPPAQEPVEFGENETELVKRLFQSMASNYGALFLANLDSQEAQKAWERLWTASIAGKNPEQVVRALKWCLDEHTGPFTRADFQHAYRSLAVSAAYRLSKQKRLPKETWEERKDVGKKHLRKIREAL